MTPDSPLKSYTFSDVLSNNERTPWHISTQILPQSPILIHWITVEQISSNQIVLLRFSLKVLYFVSHNQINITTVSQYSSPDSPSKSYTLVTTDSLHSARSVIILVQILPQSPILFFNTQIRTKIKQQTKWTQILPQSPIL
jgi:hypothetical protein